MQESEAMAVLVSSQGLGYARREAALSRAGSALALMSEPGAYASVLGAHGLDALRRALTRADALLDSLYAGGVHLIVRGSEGYPARLAQTAKPPHLLFCLGQAMLDDAAALAVVGTRRPSAYGVRHTRAIARDLAAAGVCVVSGLALGIDTQAHEGALEGGGRTVAVLGSALDRLYPVQNGDLMARIVASGGSVLSEYPPGVGPTRYSFLERNRIIAGLSLGVLVTEGAARSGALSTAHHALDEGREVFALPGDVDRESAALPNRLIAEGAQPVARASDILRMLVEEKDGSEGGAAARRRRPSPARAGEAERSAPGPAEPADQAAPGGDEAAVLALLQQGDLDFDQLCAHTGMDSDALGALLMMMELDGRIEALPGDRYRHA